MKKKINEERQEERKKSGNQKAEANIACVLFAPGMWEGKSLSATETMQF